MRHRIRGLTSATLLAAVSTLFFVLGCCTKSRLPGPTANEQLLLQVHAQGDQIYTCKGAGPQFTWTLKAPEAQLFDKDGKPFGKHFAGPSWEANDGSRVTGRPVANAPSCNADSIPWLQINTVSHDGKGVLSRATTIQRINTKVAKRQRPAATLRMPARKSACRTPPTTASTPRNNCVWKPARRKVSTFVMFHT